MACRTSQRTITRLKHMADAVTAQWHGHNYQSRVFWLNAFDLLIPETCVREVTFEANGPKSFDDVVVIYEPAVARSGPERIAAEYHQIKWHVQTGGRFGYTDLTDPKFIGATRYSLLERLKAAKETAAGPCRFLLVTPDRIAHHHVCPGTHRSRHRAAPRCRAQSQPAALSSAIWTISTMCGAHADNGWNDRVRPRIGKPM
jgi:hypothetical protein